MSFIGNVEILGTMKKFPAGAMVIPLLIGCTINTFFPGSAYYRWIHFRTF